MEEKLGRISNRESIEIIKSPNGDRSTSPPEFLVRRNEIFKKRSASIENDSVGGPSAPTFGGPLKGKSDEVASSLHFKGVHPSKTGIGGAPNHFSGKLSESRDYRLSSAYPSGRKEVRADGVAIASGGGAAFAPSENKAVTLLGRYVDDRVGHKSRAPASDGLSLTHAYLRRCKMGEDSNVDIATIKDRNSPDSDKPFEFEKHSESERNIVNRKLPTGVLSHGAGKLTNGQGPKTVGDFQHEQEFSYGPGFVDKLKSRFISLSLNDKNKTGTNLRRFSSLENVLDSDNEYNTNDVIKRKRTSVGNRTRFRGAPIQSKNSFKRAKSMETLLLEPEHRKPQVNGTSRSQRPISMTDTISGLNNFINENLVIIEKSSDIKSEGTAMVSPQEMIANRITKKRDIINRQVSSISDEELPKPDTVKTYKLFFEPVGRRPNSGNVRKLPAVARQSAKNSVNNKSSSPLMKNGTQKSGVPSAQSKPSAKENVIVNGNSLESQDKLNLFAKESVKTKKPLDNDSTVEKNSPVSAEKDLETKTEVKDVTSNGYNKLPHHSTELGIKRSRPVPENKPAIRHVTPSLNNEVKSEVVPATEKKTSIPAPQVSSKIETVPIPISKISTEKISPDKTEKPITFQKPESETGSAQQQLHPPTPKEATTQNKMEILTRGPVSSPSLEINGISPENYDKVATKSNSVNASPSPSTSVADDDVLKPSALLGNKKSGLWQKNPQSQMTTTFVYNFVGKDVKSHLPTNPAPFGCKPARSKKKTRDSLENKEGLNLKNNGLDLGDIGGGESNDYDDSDDDVDELDIGANLPATSGITFFGENISCSKSSILTRRNKNHNIVFAESEPSVFVYPSEDSVYEDVDALVNHPDPSSANGPTEDQETALNHVGQLATPLRNTPSLGGSTGALSSYTPSMLGSGESFELGVSRSTFQQDIPKLETPVNQEEPPKEDELVPADPDQTSSWSSSTTSDLLF